MVSSGTDASRAFWNIVLSVGLLSRSLPPSRAATSTWRISLANSLPRALSWAPFLCLIVAHLEWPDIGSHAFQEKLMQSQVAGDLGMEGGDEHPTLAAQHGSVVRPDGGQHLDRRTDPLHRRRPDEHGVDRAAVDPVHHQVGLEAVELATERIPADADVDHPERPLVGPAIHHVAGQQDHARA